METWVNMIFNTDYSETLKSNECRCDYIITAVKDWSELGLQPANPVDYKKYFKYLYDLFELCTSKSRVITTILTDRKANKGIVTSNERVIQIMRKLGFTTISYKIWVKGDGRTKTIPLNYAHVITFAKEGFDVIRNDTEEFQYDVYPIENEVIRDPFIGERECKIPSKLLEIMILEYTQPNQVVYDPFMREGNTAVVSRTHNRNYLGNVEVENLKNFIKRRVAKVDKATK